MLNNIIIHEKNTGLQKINISISTIVSKGTTSFLHLFKNIDKIKKIAAALRAFSKSVVSLGYKSGKNVANTTF